jgi:hypothetical protein
MQGERYRPLQMVIGLIFVVKHGAPEHPPDRLLVSEMAELVCP